MRKMNYKESLLQANFCHWLDGKGLLYTASLAGVNLGPRVGAMRKRMGCKAGTPDISIFEPRSKYYGLFIELKADGGNVSDPNQLKWQQELNKRGYLSIIMPNNLDFPQAFDWLRNCVEKYLTLFRE